MTTVTTAWNFADVYEAIAPRIPDRPCLVHGERTVTWGELDRRATSLAADLVAAGLGHQAKVACYLHNGPEYLETMVAAFKAAMVPVNTNYRYGGDELVYLFDNADAEAVVFHARFAELLDGIRRRLPKVRRWYVVADDTGAGPDWAVPYEDVAEAGTASSGVAGTASSGVAGTASSGVAGTASSGVAGTASSGVAGTASSGVAGTGSIGAGWARGPDDLLLLYTGGTTGIPKGVMWRQDDLFNVLGAGGNPFVGQPPATTVAELAGRVGADAPAPVMLVACPLMHGTGQFSALIAMNLGGTVVTLVNRHFDVGELFAAVERHRATNIVIVGQAFAQPMLEHLEAEPGRYDLSSVAVISSSGVMWSQDNREGLLRHMPQALLYDSFGSSEAVGLGASVSTAGAAPETARFMVTENNAVFTDDGRRVEPGSGDIGMVAVGGYLPVGYYKDEAKTAQTFRELEGRRWSVPGDFATVNPDGTIHLLGRGSVCINTGGEKVFPEEVEEALKTHPSVRDAVVVGVPDARFGETICGVVEPADGAVVDANQLKAHVTATLAAYKAPRNVVVVDTIARAANGKVDYRRLKALAAEHATSV